MKYDLGQKYPSGCCAPSSCEDSDSKTSYPSLYFTHDEEIDMPDEGEAVIKYRKVDSGANTRDPEDPKYRCELEVYSIEPRGAGKKSDNMVSVGSAFRDAAEKKMKMKMGDEE